MKKLVFICLLLVITLNFAVSGDPNSQCTRSQENQLNAFVESIRLELVYIHGIDAHRVDTYIKFGIHLKYCYRLYYQAKFDQPNYQRQKQIIISNILSDLWIRRLNNSELETVVQSVALGELPDNIKIEILAANGMRAGLIALAEYFSNCPPCLKNFHQLLVKAGNPLVAMFNAQGIIQAVMNFISDPSLNQLASVRDFGSVGQLAGKTIQKFFTCETIQKYVTPAQITYLGKNIVPIVAGAVSFGIEIRKWYYSDQSPARAASNIGASLVGIGASAAFAAFGCGVIAGPIGSLVCFAGGVVVNHFAADWAQQFFFWYFALPKEEALEHAYNFLGVKFTASDAEVDRAYRHLALKFHPDKKGGNEQDFMKLNTYYEIIKASRENTGHIPFRDRVDAGWAGITEEQCSKRKYTSWDQEKNPNCYFEKNYKLKFHLDGLTERLKVWEDLHLDCEFADDRSVKCLKSIPLLKSLITIQMQRVESAIKKNEDIEELDFKIIDKRIKQINSMQSETRQTDKTNTKQTSYFNFDSLKDSLELFMILIAIPLFFIGDWMVL